MNEPMIVDHVAKLVFRLTAEQLPDKHLDMGAGWGHLIQKLRTKLPALKSWGLDYNPTHFPLADVPIAHADFSRDRFSFEDNTFDLITCTEVFEHLENFRHAVREAARVLKLGGLFVVSTPNILTLKSRWAFFTRGLFTYFDPLPLKNDPNIYPGQRHITPIPFFYLAHAMLDCGFDQITPHADKAQRSSAALAVAMWPLLRFSSWNSLRRRRRRFPRLPDEVERLAELHHSWPVLTGRTLIVSARKRTSPN